MSDCKIYPADTVDIYGNVWPTVGENIRNGVFGENVKVAKIKIDGKNITSNSIKIWNIQDYSFAINKFPFMVIIDVVYSGQFSISIAYFSTLNSVLNFTNKLETIKADIKILYKE